MRRPCHIMMMLETTAARPKKMLIMWLCLSGEGRGEISVEFVVDSELAIGAMIDCTRFRLWFDALCGQGLNE